MTTPLIRPGKIGVAFDMYGCPNTCRHCWLRCPHNRDMTVQEVRWGLAQFRHYARPDGTRPFARIAVSTSWLEPDYSDDYEQLYELERQLGDYPPARYELLSVWRLAQDKDYAAWAARIGPSICQITFFGVQETHDWFCRRQGAFKDNITATKRLLEAGIKPRWQLFLTTKGIPELGEVMKLAGKMKLAQRVEALGGEFVMFAHTPGPDGPAVRIEHLRPTAEQLSAVPSALMEASRRHVSNQPDFLQPESALLERILAEPQGFPYAYEYPRELWFLVTSDFDVYPNIGSVHPWWRLGNLRTDGIARIVETYEQDRCPGLRTIHSIPLRHLATVQGDSAGRKVYDGTDDLAALYVDRYCQDAMKHSAML